MHLRYAPERIRVLHILFRLGHNLAAIKKLAHALSGEYLAAMRAHLVHGIDKRLDESAIGIERHGRYGIGPIGQPLAV